MTRIFITRHGETDWNREGIAQGRTDIPLNKAGIEQAGRLAKRLASERIDVIYSSSLSRALDTARIVQRFHPHAKIVVDEDLVEICLGESEGVKLGVEWKNELFYDVPIGPGGESPRDVLERAVRAINRIILENPEKSALIVSHGGVKRMLTMHLRDHTWDKVKDLRFGNTSLSIFTVDGQTKAEELFNCTAHLDAAHFDNDGIAWKK